MAAAAAADGVNAPFDPLLLPFADRGGAELEAEERQALAVFSPEARATIDRALVQFLSQLAAPALREHAALRRFPWESDDRAASADEVVEVLHEYPLLAELLAAWAQRSACAHAELAVRVQREWPGLRVDAIAPYQSDPHDGGRTVATLALCDGSSAVSTVVYKPRSVEMEHAFGDLLTWANARQFPWPFRRVEVMPRDGYGWMERVAAAPCETRQEVEAFFARAGGLLALAALLQGTDLHHENLIAARDQPVLVDLETLFQPRRMPLDFRDALTETGLLPMGNALDFSALGATEAFDTPFQHRVPLRENVPLLDGRRHTAVEHVDALVGGFREMFLLFIHHRREIASLIGSFAGRPVRVVTRASNAYGLLLRQSLQPRYMRDRAARRQLFARLRDVTIAELHALERMDVPYFTAPCDPSNALAALERVSASDLPACINVIHLAIRAGERNGH